MKLNKLFLLFCSVVTLISCSNSTDEPPVDLAVPTKLSVAVQTKSAVTKAGVDANAYEGEMNINRLDVLVFNADGTEIWGQKSDTVNTTNGTARIIDVPAKTGLAQIVAIANAPENAFNTIQTISQLQNVLADLSTQNRHNLTMSAPVITTTAPLEKEDNYIGFGGVTNINGLSTPLLLTRIGARVDIKHIATDFKGSLLEGRSVKIDGIYLVNAKSASRFYSAEDWGTVEVNGNLAYGTGAENAGEVIIADSKSVNYLTATPDSLLIKDNNSAKDITSFYTFENMDGTAPTRIVIKATLLPYDMYAAETKYFTAVINPDGASLKYDHNYIRRNYVYRLDITLSDKSFEGDEVLKTDLAVSIKVTPWNTVVMEPDLQ